MIMYLFRKYFISYKLSYSYYIALNIYRMLLNYKLLFKYFDMCIIFYTFRLGSTGMGTLLINTFKCLKYDSCNFTCNKNKKQTPRHLVRKQAIPTELPPLVGQVSANFCG
jgi:hypothetical protein